MTDSLRNAQALYHSADPSNPQDPAFSKAMHLLSQIVESADDKHQKIAALALRFHIFYLWNDAPSALHDLNQAIEMQPRNATLWYNRGFINKHLNDYAAALKDFQQCRQLANAHADDELYDAAEDCMTEVQSAIDK